MSEKRILTGDRPTGPLHLGHYFGSLQNRVRLQNEGYETFIIIADYQVLTDRTDTSHIRENIYELMKDYIAVGLDPKKTTFFVQSQIPQLAELTLLFSMLVTTNRLSRNPTVKEEVQSMGLDGQMSLGMFSYPVSQAADILLFKPSLIPVGEDQLPHIEQTREIARKFNSTYQEVFPIPEPLLSNTPRLAGLDGAQKMSKSRGNAIFFADTDEIIRDKIKSARTDSGTEIKYDPEKKPYLSALIELFSLTSGEKTDVIEKNFIGSGYKEFKEGLADSIINLVAPLREKRQQIREEEIQEILKKGRQQVLELGTQTLTEVKQAMQIKFDF